MDKNSRNGAAPPPKQPSDDAGRVDVTGPEKRARQPNGLELTEPSESAAPLVQMADTLPSGSKDDLEIGPLPRSNSQKGGPSPRSGVSEKAKMAAAITLEDRPEPDQRAASPRPVIRSTASLAPQTGERFGDFEVLEQLGKGGMGVVFAARDPALERKVAIKVLRDTGFALARERLMREAQAMAKLAHPNVITVHQVGIRDGQVFVVMEYVEGGTLKTWMEDDHDVEQILEIFTMAGRGLAAAHEAGLVHRDFKPENVLMHADGRAGVTDFGLVGVELDEKGQSKTLAASSPSSPLSSSLTKTGDVMGTPFYMAPEQFLGDRSDARTDQFAFCIALYEALYGRRPFGGATFKELASNVTAGTVRPPPEKSDVPAWILRVLERGLKPEPAERFANMSELLAALAADPRKVRRRQLAIAGMLASLVAVGFGAAFLARPGDRCENAGREIHAVWTDQAKNVLAQRLGAHSTSARLTKDVEQYVERWAKEQRASCRATYIDKTQSETFFHRRSLCMQMHLSRFRATLEQVGELDPKSADRSDKAMAVVIALPNFKECRDKSIQMGLPPVPPGQLAAVKQANALITRAQTKRIAHDVKAAQTLLKQVFSRLETIKYLPLTAYAHLEAGQLAVARVKHKIAEKHFRAAIKASAKSKAAHFEARGWLSLVFTIGHRLGRHKDALALRDAAEAAVARAGNEPVLVARLAGNIGLILKSSGDYRGAHKQLLRSVALFERENGKKHVDTATARNNLAMVLNGLGKSKQAYKQLLEVLAIREELVGKDHPDVATTLNDMGDAAHNLGRLKLAKKHIERALTIRKTKLGEMSSRTGNTENNLAIVLGDLGQHQKALAHAKRAVAIAEKHFGKNHPEVAGPLNTMGNQLRDLGQQKAAWQAYARGMALIEWGWGKKHVAAAPFKENLARILVRMGLHDRAIVFINQAIDLRRAGQGQYHPELINAIALRGSFNLEASRFELAIADFEKQVELSRKTFGEKSSDYARALFNLAIGQEKQKQYLKAKYNYYRAVRVLEASAPKNVLRVNALRGMADVAYAQKAYAEAEKHYRDAAALARLLRAGPRGAILHLLGNALVRQKKWKEATLAFKQALPLRKGSDPAQLALTELRLAEALWDGKLDRKRARELAKTARERFVQAGKRAEDNVKEVDAWLRKHR